MQFIDWAASLLPEAWATRVRASTLGTLATDRATDAAYSQLASTSLTAAGRHARAADVRGMIGFAPRSWPVTRPWAASVPPR